MISVQPNSHSFNVSAQTFQTDVVVKSKEVPVVILLWAQQIEPSVEMKMLCERVVETYQGKLVLATSDVAAEPVIAQQLGVQNLPSIRVIKDGKLVEQLDGPQGEKVVRALFDKLTLSSSEALQQELQAVIDRGDWGQATAILQEAINAEPNNPLFKVEAADVMVLQGNLEAAQTMLTNIGEDVVEKARPLTRLEFAQEASELGSLQDAENLVAVNANDLDARYALTVFQVLNRNYESALENALFILQKDRTFREDLGRKTMVRILNLLGKSNALSQQYRRRMFAYMH